MFRRMTYAQPSAPAHQATGAPALAGYALGADQTLGQVRKLDPVVDIALTTAGRILSESDPRSVQTTDLIRRIIVAPPLPWSTGESSKKIARVSDLNPILEKVAVLRENPVAVPLAAIALLIGSFFLGRVTAPSKGIGP